MTSLKCKMSSPANIFYFTCGWFVNHGQNCMRESKVCFDQVGTTLGPCYVGKKNSVTPDLGSGMWSQ